MKALLLASLLLLAACGRDATDRASPHDTKYAFVDVETDRCVADTQTGLMWQTKTRDAGLHSAGNTYSWFEPDEANGELDYRGVANAGTCSGSECDTSHYVMAVNRVRLCGYDDWRMPSKDELYSINDLRRVATPPTANVEYFPLMQAGEYWTGNDYSFQYDAAWAWNFELGHDRVDWKKTPKFVRLVRGVPGSLQAVKE